jgi:hypothetical protein
VAPGDLDAADLQCFLNNPEMDLAPDAPFGAAMLAGVPFAFALDLDAGAVDRQARRTLGAEMRDIDGQRRLPARQGADVGHHPVEANQSQSAFDEPGCLPRPVPTEWSGFSVGA